MRSIFHLFPTSGWFKGFIHDFTRSATPVFVDKQGRVLCLADVANHISNEKSAVQLSTLDHRTADRQASLRDGQGHEDEACFDNLTMRLLKEE